jgi:hypothetical protein
MAYLAHPDEVQKQALGKRLLFSGAKDVYPAELQGNNIFSLRPFLTAHLGETDALSFRQGLESLTCNRTKMHEQIGTIFSLDEPKSLCFVEPFYGSILLL